MSYVGKLAKADLLSSDGANNSELPVGTDTFVLTADSTMPLGIKWAAGGGGGAGTSLTGNSGGAISPVAGNINVVTANSTVTFVGTAGNQTLDFGLTNLSLGTSLPALNVGTQNCTYGLRSGAAIDNGIGNSLFGYETARNLTTGSNNCAFGKQSLSGITTSVQNCSFGNSALNGLMLSNGSNTAIGYASLIGLVTGTANTALGVNSGSLYTAAESSNISIGSAGVNGENNTTRIGTSGSGVGQQNRIFLAGISGAVANSGVLGFDANGQLSSLLRGTAGFVLTSGGSAASPTWQAPATNSTVSANVPLVSPLALTTSTPRNITSLALAAGTWAITGNIMFSGTPTVTGPQTASLGTTSGTIGTLGSTAFQSTFLTGSFALGPCSVSCQMRIQNPSAFTAYLVAQGEFSAGTMNACGSMYAVKVI